MKNTVICRSRQPLTLIYPSGAAFLVFAASRCFDSRRFARSFTRNRCRAGVAPEVELPKNLCGISILTLCFLLFGVTPLFALEKTSKQVSKTTISKAELRRHVTTLASDEFKGRDSAGEGGIIAAKYLAAEFKKLGLKPAGDEGKYFQEFTGSRPQGFRWFGRSRPPRESKSSASKPDSTVTPSAEDEKKEEPAYKENGGDGEEEKGEGDDDAPAPMSDQEVQEAAKKLCDWLGKKVDGVANESAKFECRNVLALLPGSDPDLKDEVIIVSAHYDHLGVRGGQVYNGADDNASGTAAVLELARALTNRKERPRRSILFAAWDAEEKGLCGSSHWTVEPTLPLDQVVAVVNMDMIGRMRNNRLLLLGFKSSEQLFDIISNRAKRAKIDLSKWPVGGCSDHWSFYKVNIPSVTLCTGAHKDYHTPTDDVEWIHFTNMERVVRMTLGLVSELANRDERVPFSTK